jgi:hypothetical protein
MMKDCTAAEISRFYLAQKAFSGMVLTNNRYDSNGIIGMLFFNAYVKTQSI